MQNPLIINCLFQMLIVVIFIFVVQGHDHGEHYFIKHITTPILREELFQAHLYHEVWTTSILSIYAISKRIVVKLIITYTL